MGFLYNRWGVQAALFIPLLMSGIFALAIGLIPEKTILIVLLTLIGATGSISPIVLTATADMSDRKSLSSAVGFIYTCQGLGFLPPCGWIHDRVLEYRNQLRFFFGSYLECDLHYFPF